ncbi:hypothetical protein ABW21_db0208805 [Orbilia brochopaga]|nr:hypothetical protein ABW21_db0208805 [Drechslerella brochopaga]
MDPSKLELHIALSLLPYLDATDVCTFRGHWNELFSSPDLLRRALRIYGSASREHQIITRLEAEAAISESSPQLTPSYYHSLFRNFSIRTHNLRRGTPVQEIRFPVRRAASTGNFVYAIADDVLVYLSPEVGGLEVVFWNHDTGEYANMRVDLGIKNQGEQPSAYSVRNLRVFEDVLVVEHTKEHRLEFGSGSSFWSVVQAFRLTSPFAVSGLSPQGNSSARRTGSYEQLSLFTTFKYRYVNYTQVIISDHSRTHYAALSGRSNSLGVGLFVWDLLTGRMVFAYEQEALGTRNITRSPMLSLEKIVMVEDSHVILVKPDLRNGDKWRKYAEESTGFKLYILTFDITVGERAQDDVVLPGEDDCIRSCVTREKDDEMLVGYNDYIQWRVVRQRAPKLNHHDSPPLTTYLNLWGRRRAPFPGNGKAAASTSTEEGLYNIPAEEFPVERANPSSVSDALIALAVSRPSETRPVEEPRGRPVECNEIHQYELTTSPSLDELPIRAIYTAVNDKLPPTTDIPRASTSEIPIGNDVNPFFLNSNGTDALSFDMVWSGGSVECLGTRLMTFHFGIRSFQLTETSSVALKRGDGPLRYHLDYSAFLKERHDRAVIREIPSIQRNVLAMAQSHRGVVVPFDVHGDERMSIYTEPRTESNIADLVMCVWGSEKLRPVV